MDRNDLEPEIGLHKISEGCNYCFAKIITKCLEGMGLEKYTNSFELTLHNNVLEIPYSWKKPKIEPVGTDYLIAKISFSEPISSKGRYTFLVILLLQSNNP